MRTTAKPTTQRRTMGGPTTSTNRAASNKNTKPASSTAAPTASSAGAAQQRRRATAAGAPTGTTTSSSAPRRTMGGTTTTRRTAAAPTSSSTNARKSASPSSTRNNNNNSSNVLGNLYGPSPTRSTRSRLEQLAEEENQQQQQQYDGAAADGSPSRNQNREITSIGRHSDLDDMSPENASLKELIELREKQHHRVKDLLVNYNGDLQKKLDTASAIGSLPRYEPSPGSPSQQQQQNQQNASPSTGGGGRARAHTVGPVSTADEAKLIEELLNEKNDEEEQEKNAETENTTGAATQEEGSGEQKQENNADNNHNNNSVTDGHSASSRGPDTPRTGSSGTGGVSRTALRAIVKHAQDTVNKAIDEDRERQAEFEETVLGRMQAMERMLGALQNAVRETHEARVAAEEQDRTIRNSEFQPLQEQVNKIEEDNIARDQNNKEKLETLESQIEFIQGDLQALANNIKQHQQDLDEKTRAHAEELTKKSIDEASDRVRELCEAVERGLTLTERVRDDIPQAIITSVENVEASLHQAMQSEFDAHAARLRAAEEQQAELNKQNKDMLDREVRTMKEVTGETLGELRRDYDGAITDHIDEVRKKAEEYEEARRAALPVPDTDRVKLMQQELESSLEMLKYLTEASSSAMASTIPPRLERSEQKTAELEATLESQQHEIDRIRHADVRFDVAVGPDNLKDAWLGVSSYRAVPPPVGDEDGESSSSPDKVIGFDENGNPIEQYSPETMHEVHNQISEALRLIARRHTSMSPLRGSVNHHHNHHNHQDPNNNNNNNNSSSLRGPGGAEAGMASGFSSSPQSTTRLPVTTSASADTLPDDFDSLSPRVQLETLNQTSAAKRAQLVTIQKVLSNIQHAFHELTAQEAEIMSQSSPSRLAPTGGTPRTIAEYQHNRQICDEIAARKSRMYEKERQVVEKRNKLTREIEALQERENEVFRVLSASVSARS